MTLPEFEAALLLMGFQQTKNSNEFWPVVFSRPCLRRNMKVFTSTGSARTPCDGAVVDYTVEPNMRGLSLRVLEGEIPQMLERIIADLERYNDPRRV